MRQANIHRDTKETQIQLAFGLDGTPRYQIETGVGFFDHMLTLFAVHGLFDLSIKAKGDLHIDAHHTVEDVGICLGQAFRQALGDAVGIKRYASCIVPMDEVLVQVAIDLSNRPHLSFNAAIPKVKIGDFDSELAEEFFKAFVSHARITLHMSLLAGDNLHHCIEGCFKAFAICLDEATQIDPRKKGIPSSKGVL